MEALEQFLSGLGDFELYGIAFVFYFAFAYVIRKFVLKVDAKLKDNLISALFGLLLFVSYMTFFVY